MKLEMYTIYDAVAKAYNQPFYMVNKGQAIRAFEDNVNDESTTLNKHPEQYILFKVGIYDDQTAEIETQVELVLKGNEVVKNQMKVTEVEKILNEIKQEIVKCK